jgi:hypothetical protein
VTGERGCLQRGLDPVDAGSLRDEEIRAANEREAWVLAVVTRAVSDAHVTICSADQVAPKASPFYSQPTSSTGRSRSALPSTVVSPCEQRRR